MEQSPHMDHHDCRMSRTSIVENTTIIIISSSKVVDMLQIPSKVAEAYETRNDDLCNEISIYLRNGAIGAISSRGSS